jgi:hypothetical protein
LHYEPTNLSLAQQALIQELYEVITDHDEESQEMGDPRLHGSDALKALVLILRLALDRSSGRPLSRVGAKCANGVRELADGGKDRV